AELARCTLCLAASPVAGLQQRLGVRTRLRGRSASPAHSEMHSQAVKALFRRARAAAPAVVFFDEMDALASTREEGSGAGASSSSERVLNQLLTEMDGLQPLLGVSVVAATNRPDLIDPALLRPGRFDRLLYVGPPTGTSNRADIFRVHLKRTPLAEDVVLEDLAELAAGYTGADVTAVCREAGLAALEEDIGACTVAKRHFLSALASVPASKPPEDMAFYQKFRRSS
ncbi:hypothetical protein CYMTET_7708, partial [Cymbomonas tetramitiformis]